MSKHDRGPDPERPRSVDWAVVRQRLDLAREAIEREGRPSPAESRRVLKERARILALPPEAPPQAGEGTLTVVEFMLATERYGIESRFVREVDPMKELTLVPCTPRFLLGVVNLRGEMISVVDLKRLFDLPDIGLTELDRIIVVRDGSMQFGIHANSVVGVRQVRSNDVEGTVSALSNIRGELIIGVTRDGLIVLDGQRLLARRDLVVNEEVET